MSLLAVQGGATGTGTVTLLAPVTNTNRTLTLPDETGTLITAASNTYIGGRGQVFTSSGTFTVPTGITAVKVTVIGGGGNGSNITSTGGQGAGGGGGGVAIEFVTGLTPGDTVTVTVGGAAGTSSFGAFCSATGGASAAVNASTGAAGGAGSGGDINMTGGQGGNNANNNLGGPGPGGGSSGLKGIPAPIYQPNPCTFASGGYGLGGNGYFGGAGGVSAYGAGNGAAATGFGNGGSGASSTNTTDYTGGAGSGGIVVVEF